MLMSKENLKNIEKVNQVTSDRMELIELITQNTTLQIKQGAGFSKKVTNLYNPETGADVTVSVSLDKKTGKLVLKGFNAIKGSNIEFYKIKKDGSY